MFTELLVAVCFGICMAYIDIPCFISDVDNLCPLSFSPVLVKFGKCVDHFREPTYSLFGFFFFFSFSVLSFVFNLMDSYFSLFFLFAFILLCF